MSNEQCAISGPSDCSLLIEARATDGSWKEPWNSVPLALAWINQLNHGLAFVCGWRLPRSAGVLGMKTLPFWFWPVLLAALSPARAAAASSFVNFETAPIHPVALSPDHDTLAICNLPDGRIELL